MEQKQNPRPQGAPRQSGTARPAGTRPAQARPAQARPAQARPAGAARPAQRKPQQQGFEMPAFIQRWQKKRAWRKKKIAQLTPKQLKIYKKRRWERHRRYISRAVLSLLTVVAVLACTLLGAGFVVFRGPSQTFGDMLTVTFLETSALKFIPHIFYSNKTVDEIVQRNSTTAPTEDTDTSLITINTGVNEDGTVDADYKDIEVFEVVGGTYRGYMMIVRDPSRVSVGVCRENFNKEPGLQLFEIAQKYNAVAAINGGAFSDSGGTGNGGMPLGPVVSNGKVLHASGGGEENTTVGFTQDHKLVVGEFSRDTLKNLNLRDAVTFGPALVINGEACEVSGISSGLNPRTAIGQREDGAVLMLVIDGRQVNSLGATHADLMKIMLEYGAVNACNLDGGSSSIMYHEGKYLNNGVAVTGSRKIPTAFVVR